MNKKAFEIEKKRQRLAKKGRKEELKSLYDKKNPEIKDLNAPSLWDDIYSEEDTLNTQDRMTKDRIRTAVSYIPKRKAKVLDIGAGLGFVEEMLSQDKDKELYACDFSEKSVEVLKKRYSGDFSLQSIYKLKYPANYFDVVLVLEVLEHIPPSKIFNVLNKINSLMKKNGVLIVSVPMNEGLEKMKDNPSGHVRMYTKDLIYAELEVTGFKVLKHKTLFAFGSLYEPKTLIARGLKTHEPNNIVLKAIKT